VDPVDKWPQRVLSTHIFNFIHSGTLMHWIECKTKIQSSVVALKISNTELSKLLVTYLSHCVEEGHLPTHVNRLRENFVSYLEYCSTWLGPI